ncbi:MAG: hemolysin family protein [Frankiaceae bacterium]
MIWLNIVIVAVLILIEALFVAAEMALVSLRESQVNGLAERSRRGMRVKQLVGDPNRFLSAVQIGVTTTALLSSAFGAVTLTESAAGGLRGLGLSRTWAHVLGFIGVTLVISYVTLVVGELAPKRLALQRAEGMAQGIAPLLDRFARLMRPVIWFLSRSTDLVVRALGGDPNVNREAITEEELRDLVAAHESLSSDERRLIDEVFAAGERQVREVMIPRTEVEFLDANETIAKAAAVAATAPHSRYPVFRGSHDDVVGFVHVRDLFGARRDPGALVAEVLRQVKMLPSTKKVLSALSEMRREGHHLAIVADEYGGTAGIVTLEDLIEEVIGDIRDEYDVAAPQSRRLLTGEVEIDGLLNLDEFEEETGLRLPDGPYETAAGFVMAALGHLPEVGESVEVEQVRLTVASLDGRRVARVRVTPLTVPDGDEQLAGADVPSEPARRG